MRRQNQCYPGSVANAAGPALTADSRTFRRKYRTQTRLLPVAFQHLIAGDADLGAILLQAGKDGEVALIDHGPAVSLNVAGARLLLFRRTAALLLLLGESVR